MKALTGMMFCLSLAACGTEPGALSGVEASYTLVEVDGSLIEVVDSEGTFASFFDLFPSLRAMLIINPTLKPDAAADDLNPFYTSGDVSGMYTLVATDRISIVWEVERFRPEQSANVEDAKTYVGDPVVLEGDWLYLEIGLVQNPLSIFYPYSESRLGYLTEEGICAGQAGPDLVALFTC